MQVLVGKLFVSVLTFRLYTSPVHTSLGYLSFVIACQ